MLTPRALRRLARASQVVAPRLPKRRAADVGPTAEAAAAAAATAPETPAAAEAAAGAQAAGARESAATGRAAEALEMDAAAPQARQVPPKRIGLASALAATSAASRVGAAASGRIGRRRAALAPGSGDADASAGAEASTSSSSQGAAAFGWTSQQAKNLRESVEQLTRARLFSFYTAAAGGVVLSGAAAALALNWHDVRSRFSQESAEVVQLTIRDEQLQFTVGEISKELLRRVMTDEEIARTTAGWVLKLLNSIQDDIGALFVKILALQPVVDAVNRLADKLVAYLCASTSIQEQVGRLLVDAICLEYSRNAAAAWTCELVMRDDTTASFRDLVVGALQSDAVVQQAQVLGSQIVDYILRDPAIFMEARRTLTDALRDDEVRGAAKESLWNVLLPSWGARANTERQRCVKHLGELLALSDLTPEERATLRALQIRLQSTAKGGSANANATSGSAASTASKTAASSSSAGVSSTSVGAASGAGSSPSSSTTTTTTTGVGAAAVEESGSANAEQTGRAASKSSVAAKPAEAAETGGIAQATAQGPPSPPIPEKPTAASSAPQAATPASVKAEGAIPAAAADVAPVHKAAEEAPAAPLEHRESVPVVRAAVSEEAAPHFEMEPLAPKRATTAASSSVADVGTPAPAPAAARVGSSESSTHSAPELSPSADGSAERRALDETNVETAEGQGNA
eukprot:TRINITY_DN1996_c1_g1_i2.p1 TRINITY_DN1996_c1_g1~~TRINITY_DN1996_c1_g1_i2.p1  ORF type:complete len:690 (-),score=190.23 TRINITY_DN1996_c1_g1_i2:55-2124(-)